ncbi:MAG: hypothetical protein ACYDC8_15510 [Gammaproteobacteria bacterium]
MSKSLFSPFWYRVAALKPRLRNHAQILRHHYRGELWYVLRDRTTNRHHRFRPAAHYLIAQMNGARSVQYLWTVAGTALGDDAPTQDEVIELLGQLHAADVLQCDVPPDSLELFERYRHQKRQRWLQRLMNPMSQRFPLLDPERVLNQGLPWVRALFTRGGLIAWLGVVGLAVILASLHWSELTRNVVDRTLAPKNLLILWLTYPLIKAAHEFGHAFATRVWGGEVHEMGIMLLVLMPIPYVDASAASGFRSKHRRMVVGAAGIMVELFLASLALFVWLNVESGLASAVAFNVMLIGSVSTLFFNGNPLLRFDGYYILADATDIPNLGSRSNQYLAYLIQRYLLGVDDLDALASGHGERAWLVCYGIASFIYRTVILFTIVLYIADKYFFIGVLLAIWAVISQLVIPFHKALHTLLNNPRLRHKRSRMLITGASIAVTVAALLFLLPVPFWTSAEGVVWLPEQAQVRAGTDCFVARLLTPVDSVVHSGEALLECTDPLLPGHVNLLAAQLRELQARASAQWAEDRVKANVIKEKIKAAEAALVRAQQQVAKQVIRSGGNGSFVVPRADDLLGRYAKQGELLGYVVDRFTVTVRVVVDQSEIGLVRQRAGMVVMRFSDRVGEVVRARIAREVPAATDQLPNAALGSVGGGRMDVDPTDKKGLKTLQKVFQFDVVLPAPVRLRYIGTRVYARIEYGTEPLGQQWYRSLRQLFLRRFDV